MPGRFSEAYPALARIGDDAVRLARNFTMVFMEGLSLYRFDRDSEANRQALIAMLKTMLIEYWSAKGVSGLEDRPSSVTPGASVAPRDNARRRRALALIHEAAEVLADDDG